MPTGACGPEGAAEDRNEEHRPRGGDGAEYLAECPRGYRLPSAQQCRIPDVQKWLDLCA